MRACRLFLTGLFFWLFLFSGAVLAGDPTEFKDAAGRIHQFETPPATVVSLVPSLTEILFRIGAGDAVAGVTYHDVFPPQAATKTVVGGFFAPSLEKIAALRPDVIFLDDIHQPVVDAFAGKRHPHLVQLPLDTVDDLYRSIRLLGRIFDRGRAAEDLIGEIKADLSHTAEKVAAIPDDQRKRVMRLMGRDRVMTPGDDSFQNEIIRRAGGIPPALGRSGGIVTVSLEEWQAFNPQVIYGCGGDREVAMKMLDQPGWREVDAVKNGRVIYFPCDLTCRLASRTGYFVSCLASRVYGDEFAGLPPVRPDGRLASRSLPLALPYVDGAEIVDSIVNDYIHKTLVVHLNAPMAVASTLEGFRGRINHVGNSYSPPQVWGLLHRIGLERSREQLMQSIGRDRTDTSLLFTGADMDNLSVQRQQYKEMSVYALVTAGVRSNAVRMAEDVGAYYEPGTINMIILANRQLTPRAMNRAIISATEAKTTALQDLDIRSSYTPMTNPATGTGTDNIIVVQGAGPRINNAGGHSKMGELIARAVYAGVQEAIFKQNGITSRRHLVQRLKDRRISLFGLVDDCPCGVSGSQLTAEVERMLMDPAVAGFIEAAMAISDAQQRGLITSLAGFAAWCDQTAAAVAGQPILSRQAFSYSRSLPPALKMAFDALLNGAAVRLNVPTAGQ
jgi:ABC-type Fe3+-hydroxamate transport system substrate-binding protein/adenosylcobinamide amidohydrolase